MQTALGYLGSPADADASSPASQEEGKRSESIERIPKYRVRVCLREILSEDDDDDVGAVVVWEHESKGDRERHQETEQPSLRERL